MSRIRCFESREKLLESMERIAKRTVKHYFSDFTDYDVKTVKEAETGKSYIWLLRETGTYLLQADSLDMINAVFSNMRNVACYSVVFGRAANTLQKLDVQTTKEKYSMLYNHSLIHAAA